jgi:hypothetical protein
MNLVPSDHLATPTPILVSGLCDAAHLAYHLAVAHFLNLLLALVSISKADFTLPTVPPYARLSDNIHL